MNNNKGFSLIEILTVVSLAFIIMVVGFVQMKASRERLSVDQAQAAVSFALEEAQDRAATGYGTKKHGVHVEARRLIIFEDDSYSGVGQEIALPVGVSVISAIPADIIFNRISASKVGADTVIQLRHDNNVSLLRTVNITSNGKISIQ